jgi:hypothetical protein
VEERCRSSPIRKSSSSSLGSFAVRAKRMRALSPKRIYEFALI